MSKNYHNFYKDNSEPINEEIVAEEVTEEPVIPAEEDIDEPVSAPVEEVKEEEPAPVVEEAPKKASDIYVVAKTPKLNVRKTPNGEVVNILNEGAQVTIDSNFEDNDWYKIKEPTNGYVMKKYIQVK